MTVSTSDFTAIRAFVAVGEALSFAQAAKALRVTPSAVSQAISGLEDRLGEILLHRTTRSMSLTDAGSAFLAQMAPVMKAMADGLKKAHEAGDEPRGTVRIHSFRTAASIYLPSVLHCMAMEHPQLTIDVTLSDEAIDPAAAGFDAAIRLGETIEKDLVAVRIGGPLRQLAVATSSYVERYGAPATPADLMHHRCILWRWPGTTSVYEWEFSEKGRWFTVRPQGTIIVSERDFAIRVALTGAGIAMASEPLVADHVRSGALLPLLEPWCGEYPGFYLCYPQHRTVSRGLRLLIDALERDDVMLNRQGYPRRR